jgi:glycosyltransferase involved in cell wall biosynthesis
MRHWNTNVIEQSGKLTLPEILIIMNFLIVTHAAHKVNGQQIGGYAPYVREMNMWAKYVSQITIVAPVSTESFGAIDLAYQHPVIKVIAVPAVNFTTGKEALKALPKLPGILLKIGRQMKKADHIHLRCPGNMGLLGCLAQIFFPGKKKTAKYAGNWDWKSSQPKTYRIQQRILNNTFLTRNMQALVYGDWPNLSKNMLPFFTATYSQKDVEPTAIRILDKNQPIILIYVGTLSKGKQPLLSIKVAQALVYNGYSVVLNMFGEGEERAVLETYISDNQLVDYIKLMGNQPAQVIQEYYKKSHFLIFISKSEGWPKVVAESMFWGCVPITTSVSCVPEMVGNGERGTLVANNSEAVVQALKQYLHNPALYAASARKGMDWSRQYTLEKFESEIKKLL